MIFEMIIVVSSNWAIMADFCRAKLVVCVVPWLTTQRAMDDEQIDHGSETPPPLVANPDGDNIDGTAAMGEIAYGHIH